MNFSSYFRDWSANSRVEIFSDIVVACALIPEAIGFSSERRYRPENRFICLGRHRLRADHRLIVMGDGGRGTSPVAAVSKTP